MLSDYLTGRWQGLNRNERICNLCNWQEIGDEYHYIVNCTHFARSRSSLLPAYMLIRPNTIKFALLFKEHEIRILYNLCKFISIIQKGVCETPG